MRKVLLVVAILAVAGSGWWLLRTPADDSGQTPEPPTTAVEAGDRHESATALTSEHPAPSASTPVESAAAERRAVIDEQVILRVRAVWPDASPAAGVSVYLREAELDAMERDVAAATTDASGDVTFSALRLGRHRLRSDRDDRQVVQVVAGTQEVTFKLAAGVHVVGTVRDGAGRPIAAAGIWLQSALTSWDAGREVARSDARGEFALQHMNPRRSLGAFAAGHAPSALTDLEQLDTKQVPVRVELVLGPAGGELVGVVRDAEGKPVASAIVAAGRQPRFLDHRGEEIVEVWTPRTTRTDAAGAFTLEGLASGEQPVAVRATGYGVWRGSTTIRAGEAARVEVVLLTSATVSGRVADAHGKGAAGAKVSLYDRSPGTRFFAGGQIDYDEVFGHAETTADADGRFRLTGVTPGEVHAFAQRGAPRDQKGRARRPEGVSVAHVREQLRLEPGEQRTWNPVLEDGNSVAGVVRYSDGEPMGDVFVTLQDEQSELEQVMTNASDGTFRFLCLPLSTFRVRVQYWDAPEGMPALERSGLQPNGGPVELRAPFAKPVQQQRGTVVGRIDDAGRRIKQPATVRVQLHSDQRWQLPFGKLVDGAYRFEDVEPCRFRIVLMEGETMLAQSDWQQLAPAAMVDAGVLSTEPGGALRIRIERGTGCESVEPKLYLRRDGDAQSSGVELRGDSALAPNLTPGDYAVTGYGQGICTMSGRAIVRAGDTSDVTLSMRAGTPCRIDAWLPEGTSAATGRFRVVGNDGAVLMQRELSFAGRPTRPFPVAITLPQGTWRLLFEVDGGGRGEVEFAVAGSGEVQARVDVR